MRQRPNGRWQALWRDPTSGKQTGRTFRSRREAERFAGRVEVQKERGEYRDPAAGKRTFGEVSTIWLGQKTGLNPGTLSNYDVALRLHLLPTFEDVQVASITPEMVLDWTGQMRQKGAGESTVARSYRVLASVLDTAVDLQLIASSPALTKFRPRTPQAKEMRFLTRPEVRDLADKIGPHWSTLIWTAADTGMRKSELIGLRVKRVDLLRRTIDVAETLTDVKGVLITGPPKSKAGRRTIPLTRLVSDLLTDQMAGKGPDDLVFTGKQGGPIRASNFHKDTWQPAIKRVGLEGLRFHDLRHSHVTWLIAAQVPVLEITRRLGHSKVAFCLDRYGHLFPGAEQAALALDAMHDRMAAPNEATVTRLSGGDP